MRGARGIWAGLLAVSLAAGCGGGDKVLQADGNDASTAKGDGGGGGGGGDGNGGGGNSDGGGGGGDGNGGGGNGGDGADGNGTGGDAGSGGGGDGSSGTHVAKDADCDMNGVWIAMQTTRSDAFGGGQYANNWYYMELEHDGEDVVVKRNFDCGILVKGSATVGLSKTTTEALMQHNVKNGRKGKMYKDSGSCHFEMERYWNIRGADESKYAPSPRNSTQSISDVQASNPLPTPKSPNGAEDWDNDGKLGVAWKVMGIVNGTRNTVQRDWIEWFSDDTHSITPATDFTSDLLVRARFDNEEIIFDPTSGLLTTQGKPNLTAEHLLTLRFLGRDTNDARAKAIIKSADIDTCYAVQAAIPARDGL